MSTQLAGNRYDVIIAGARAAGASTAMLLARQGLRVLVVDPGRRGSDTLSTHALMRGGVVQLHRWGLLDRLRAAGTPAIRKTTFQYDRDVVEVDIQERDGVDALYAPRRTLLDESLVTAAEEAGAEVVHGVSLDGLLWDAAGRVRGAYVSGRSRTEVRLEADLVIGADGRRSGVARLVGAEVLHLAPHATANVFGYWADPNADGYHWLWRQGRSAGVIPTNDGESCVFVGFTPEEFHAGRQRGLDELYMEALTAAWPEMSERLLAVGAPPRLRAFAGAPGFLRQPHGPGWALVGDAGYFKDPITAHGITDALRDAELLARAAVRGTPEAFAEYAETRERLSSGLLAVTDRLASLEWSSDEARELHLTLSREMSAEAKYLAGLDDGSSNGGEPPRHQLLRSA
jgi:2-polyprenyl-6-methoxyphenol hydroxylase-like FAD-dependent oxidoreductase